MRRKNHVGFVDFYEDEDENEIVQLCHHCKEYGVTSKLGPRQVKEGEEPGPDWEIFKQCATCGTIYGLYEVASTPQIKDSTKTIDNPFEQGKFVSESIPKRSSVTGKKASAKRRRNKIS